MMEVVLENQAAVQKNGFEKIASDMSRTQLFIAQNLKDNQTAQQSLFDKLGATLRDGYRTSAEEQRAGFNDLGKVLSDSYRNMGEAQQHQIQELGKALTNGYRQAAEEQRAGVQELGKVMSDECRAISTESRAEISELCKMVAQSQTALQTGLSNLVKTASLVEKSASATSPKSESLTADDGATRRLIEVVLDGQKQLNSRLDKVEELSLSRANDNKRMLEVFEKSQTEMWQKLEQNKTSQTVVSQGDNSEKIAQLISKSQAELVQTILSNVQNNSANQNTNNANNIQITTPDSSASLLQLVDKIAALQVQGENKMEKALSKVLESQSILFDKMSRHQTNELGEILAKAFREGFSSLQQTPLVVMPTSPAAQEQYDTSYSLSENDDGSPLPIEENLPPEEYDAENIADENMAEDISFENVEMPMAENLPDPNSENTAKANEAEKNEQTTITPDDTKRKKKKKKKKKKTPQNSAQELTLPQELENITETENTSPADIFDDMMVDNFDMTDLPEISEMSNAQDTPQTAQDSPTMEIDEEPEAVSDFSLSSETEEIAEELADSAEESKNIVEGEKPTLAEEVSSDTTEPSSQDWGIAVDDDEQRSTDTTTAGDWGFDTAESEDNDNQAEQDWEWAYVEDDTESEDSQEYAVEAIGGNSYIYCAELDNQCDNEGTNSIIYNAQPVHLVKCPKIVASDSEDEEADPYQNSILKD
jgi:hypothetical protein